MSKKKTVFSLIGSIAFVLITSIVMGDKNKEIKVHDYTYVGESKHWRGEYYLRGEEIFYEEDGVFRAGSWHNDQHRIIYRGKVSELKSLEHLEVTFRTSTRKSKTSRTFSKPPKDIFFELGSGGGNGNFVNLKDPIEVEVIWDGQLETFMLYRDDL
ncbi:hypothetical protein ACFSTA_05030 [Ornithinibacillus salinisoli]|uniref:MORN repeat protein n=1 Tax=Ornithinibacillus salinisoli TaxID=1848459 RepID=A0ABW4W022_9BACI